MKYVALLRGINVGGNNKVSMKELKNCFEVLGFNNVQTYINSGNVIFETPMVKKEAIVKLLEKSIEDYFGFKVICSVISSKELSEALKNAPEWWGADVGASHNALFVIAPSTPEIVLKEIGVTKPEYEKYMAYGQVIFWSAPVKTFGRTCFSKIVGTPVYRSITIRNINTTKKLAMLSRS